MRKSQTGTAVIEILIALAIMGIIASFVSGDSKSRKDTAKPAESISKGGALISPS